MQKLCLPMLPTDLTSKPEKIASIIKNPTEWYYEAKVDGIRILLTVEDGQVISWTRNGRIIEKLNKWFNDQFDINTLNDYVLDGEVFVDNLRKTHSILHGPSEIRQLTYYVFDIFPRKYCSTTWNIPYIKRKQLLKSILTKHSKNIVLLSEKQLMKTSPDKLKDYIFDIVDLYVKHQYEGIVLKHAFSPYVHDRSKYWWKVKKFYSLDLRCIGVVESKTKKGILGGIIVDVCGTQAIVGSGFTLKQRIEFCKNPKLIVGKIVEIRYFERTPSGKLRFPIFVRIRYDKDSPDC